MSSKKAVRAVILAAALLVAFVPTVSAQTSCLVSRSQVEAELASGATGEELYTKYGSCTASTAVQAFMATRDGVLVIQDDANIITNTGSIFWERIESCGYHPQREEAVCAIEIRQNTGFGGQICTSRGSTEYVLLCVNYGAGLVPVHTGTVHVHDAIPGSVPPWDFGVVIQANPTLASQPNNGRTLPARAILSWAIVPPQNCNWAPVWGNQADFRIRLDP